MTVPAEIAVQVLTSWDGTGAFDGPFDDITDNVVGAAGISISLGKDGSRTLDPPKVVETEHTVFNDDGTYSQERPESPIYQLVTPGRPVFYQALHGTEDEYDTGTDYDEDDYYDGVGTYGLARTAIDDISQTTALGDQRVRFTTMGQESLLVASTVTVAVMTAPRVDQCVTAILDAVGWPSDKRAVSASDTTLLYWWCDDREPWAALLELLASEGPGAIYVTGDGVFHFENRNYRTTATRSTTSQAAFFDTDAGLPSAYDEDDDYTTEDFYDGTASGLWFTDLSYDPGYRNIYNRATYTTRRRTLAVLGVVWTYGETIALSASQAITLIARPSEPFQSAVAPVGGTDYTVAGGTVTVQLGATSGLVAFITITATSGTPTVSGLQLRAQSLTPSDDTTVQNSVDASASIAQFSPIPGQNIPRVLQVGGWPEIDGPNAVAVCNAWVTRYMVQRPAVTIVLRNGDGDHATEILQRTMSDRITLFESNTGLSADVWINSKRFEIHGDHLGGVTCILGCEKVENVGGAVWDLSLWNTGVWGT